MDLDLNEDLCDLCVIGGVGVESNILMWDLNGAPFASLILVFHSKNVFQLIITRRICAMNLYANSNNLALHQMTQTYMFIAFIVSLIVKNDIYRSVELTMYRWAR